MFSSSVRTVPFARARPLYKKPLLLLCVLHGRDSADKSTQFAQIIGRVLSLLSGLVRVQIADALLGRFPAIVLGRRL